MAAPLPVSTIRYETEDMSQLRTLLRSKNVPDMVIDHFKRCLNVLTREGFELHGPHKTSSTCSKES